MGDYTAQLWSLLNNQKNNQYVMDQPPDAAKKRRACY